MHPDKMQDLEKHPAEPTVVAGDTSPVSGEDEIPPYLASAAQRGPLARLRGWEAALDRKLGVETHGISRRRPEDRDPAYASWSNQAVMFLMWMSATTNLSCFATGFLGWELGLDLSRSIVIIIFSSLIGSAVTVSFAVVLGSSVPYETRIERGFSGVEDRTRRNEMGIMF